MWHRFRKSTCSQPPQPALSNHHYNALHRVKDAPTDPVVFVSINRFERKKDIGLAVRALAQLHSQVPDKRPVLLLAGGWDPRVQENVEHYNELHATCKVCWS